MSSIVKIIFLPIMITAGIGCVTLMTALNLPVIIRHLWRERRFKNSDRENARQWREKFLASIYK